MSDNISVDSEDADKTNLLSVSRNVGFTKIQFENLVTKHF